MAAHLTPEQLARAVYLQRRLWTQERIAADVGVSQSTVSRALARHNARALKRLEKRSASIKAQQVAQLEYLAEEAASEWHRSKLDAETVKTTEEGVGTAADGAIVATTKTETTTKGQTGDPSLLREARSALADVRKILGLDAPPARPEAPFDLSQLTAEAEQDAASYVPDERPGADPAAPGRVP